MKKLLVSLVCSAMLLLGGSSWYTYAKDLQSCPAITMEIPEACPDFREFKPFPPLVFDINPDTKMAFIVQEGQKGNEFVIVAAVAQAEPEALFILMIQHSVVNMEDPEKSVTKTYADKVWIETGVPSNTLVLIDKMPTDPKFYKALNTKTFPIKKKI